MADIPSTVSGTWTYVPGRARGQNLGHLKVFYLSFSFIESIVFEQKVLFRAHFLSVTSDFRVHNQGRA